MVRGRSQHVKEASVEVAGLYLDPDTHRVTAGLQQIKLSPTEFRLLHFLMTHPESVHTREDLIDEVWDNDVLVSERTVDVNIKRLRLALAGTDYAAYIQTVYGYGYRFSPVEVVEGCLQRHQARPGLPEFDMAGGANLVRMAFFEHLKH